MPKKTKRVDLIPVSGKDSLCTALVQKKRAPGLDYHYLFCDVGMELPETYEWLDRVEKKCNIHIHRIGKSLEGLMASQRTLPSFTSRFCTRQGKIEPIMEYIRELDADETVQYIGFRFDEKDRLPPPSSRVETGRTVYPLIEEEIDIGGVYKMLDSQDILPPSFFWKRLYDEVWSSLGHSSRKFIESAPPWVMSGLFSWRSRSNCWSCHFQGLYEWAGLLEHHPDLFARAESIEYTYGNPESEFHTAMSKRIKLSVFTLNPTLSLPEIRRQKDRIFMKRVEETRKAVVEARGNTGKLDLLSYRSCGSYCGK